MAELMKKARSKLDEPRLRLKTYSHLMNARTVPDNYEITTSHLLYHFKRGFEVSTPIGECYVQPHSSNRPFCENWESFRDPRRLYYVSYIANQRDKEIYLRQLFERIEEQDVHKQITPHDMRFIASLLSPCRFLFHAFQMLAAYAGSMAPSGRIVNCFLFQASNELRRIQHFAYRLGLFRKHYGLEDYLSAHSWETDDVWQEPRRLVEQMLTLTDWIEVFVALNLCVKLHCDELIMTRGTEIVRHKSDTLFAEVLLTLQQDCTWSRQWSKGFVDFLVNQDPRNEQILQGLLEKWSINSQNAARSLSKAMRIDISDIGLRVKTIATINDWM